MIEEQSPARTFAIKPWLFDKKKELDLTSDFIEYQGIRILQSEFEGCRFGIRWLNGLKFTIGREYQIFIRSKTGQTIKITFKSFYGIKKDELWKKYVSILEALWNCNISDLADRYLEEFDRGKMISIAGVKISPDHVVIKSTAGFREREVAIAWDDLGTKNYQTYFALFSLSDSANKNCGYNYRDVWNACILQTVITRILKPKDH